VRSSLEASGGLGKRKALKPPARADIAFASGAVAKITCAPLLEFLCGIAIAGCDVFAGYQFF
jgi:hypothetical protein